MAVKISFDDSKCAIEPTLVLGTRSGKKLGVIPSENLNFKGNLTDGYELSFKLNKYNNNEEYLLWDEVINLRLIWCKDWDLWFEFSAELEDSDDTIKNIQGTSLGQAELSQVMIYNTQINTEDDISRDDYTPTTLFNEKSPESSLLHRLLQKAPHYSVKHVDSSLAKIQRTFSFDDDSLIDVFSEISQELNCIFIINSGSTSTGGIAREINVYDMESYCSACGYRNEFLGDTCPKCGSKDIIKGYGEDTSVFISVDNLADNITYTTDVDSVKNCFKIVAGDDLLTATAMNSNPNGTSYIWYFPDAFKLDMSDDLVSKLNAYDSDYDYYYDQYAADVDTSFISKYNDLIDKYSVYSSEYEKIPSKIIGYSSLMKAVYDTIDFSLFLTDGLMPATDISATTAADECNKLNTYSLSPVAVLNLDKASSSTVSNAVLTMAKILVDVRYRVRINEGTYANGKWTGSFIVTSYNDDEDTSITDSIVVTITDTYKDYVSQKLDKILNKKSEEVAAIEDLFALSISEFGNEMKKYSLNSLTGIHDAAQSCVDAMIEQGISNTDDSHGLYADMYEPYYQKLLLTEDEIKIREDEILIIEGEEDPEGNTITPGLQSLLISERNKIQKELNFESYLGDELWKEFLAYRREDTYSNDNYISDGLNNAELFDRAMEFLEVARKDIFKSATLQHSISAQLNNLLVMNEFQPIVEKFELGNWIRIKVDNEVYRLRIIEYEIDFDDLENLSVEFSDVKNVKNGVSDIQDLLSKAAKMSKSYSSVSRQSSIAPKTDAQLNSWVNDGLALSKMKIIDSAESQNITWDSHGLLGREYLPITDTYDDKQLKIINKGLYLTDDNWKTSKAGIGNFIFYNPETKQYEESYGVIANTLAANLILSEKVGIYNTSGSMTFNDRGFIVTNNRNTVTIDPSDKNSVFSITNSDGEKIIFMNDEGQGVFTGGLYSGANKETSINPDGTFSFSSSDAGLSFDSANGLKVENDSTTVSINSGADSLFSITSKTNGNIFSVNQDGTGSFSGAIKAGNSVDIQANGEFDIGGISYHNGVFSISGYSSTTDIENMISDISGVTGVTTYYWANNLSSGVTLTTTGANWQTTMPTINTTNPYLWSYVATDYGSGNVSNSSPVIIGTYSEDRVVYSLRTSTDSFSRSVSNVLSPTSVTVSAYVSSATGIPAAYTGYIKTSITTDGTTWISYEPVNSSSDSYSPDVKYNDEFVTEVKFELFPSQACNANELLASVHIPISYDMNALLLQDALNKNQTLINGTNIVTGSITAQQVDVESLFAVDITASNTITGANLRGGGLMVARDSIADSSYDWYSPLEYYNKLSHSYIALCDPADLEPSPLEDGDVLGDVGILSKSSHSSQWVNEAETYLFQSPSGKGSFYRSNCAYVEGGSISLGYMYTAAKDNDEYSDGCYLSLGQFVVDEKIQINPNQIRLRGDTSLIVDGLISGTTINATTIETTGSISSLKTMQSGTMSITSTIKSGTNTKFTVAFDSNFDKAPVVTATLCIGSGVSDTNHTYGSVSVAIYSVSKSKFSARVFNDSTADLNPVSVHWIALAKTKEDAVG